MTKKVFFNLLLGMLLTIHSLPIFAQSAPNWYDNDMRQVLPKDKGSAQNGWMLLPNA